MSATGRTHVPAKGGFILASNHASYLDPVVVGTAAPRRLYYMARHDLFRFPVFGFILRAVHAFPVKRKSADLSALKEALRLLKAGRGLLVFPEGRRSVGGEKVTPEAGVGFLAKKAGVPVIPAYVSATDKAMPKGARCIKPVKVRVRFGPKIIIERRLSYQEVSALIMEKIRQLS